MWSEKNREFIVDVRTRAGFLRKRAHLTAEDELALKRAKHRMRGAQADIFTSLAYIDVLKERLRHKTFSDDERAHIIRKLHEEEAHVLVVHDALESASVDSVLSRLVHDKLRRRYD